MTDRMRMAADPKTDSTMLGTLAASPDVGERRAVARNPSTPSSTLDWLAGDPDRVVRRLVAQHPRTPTETIKRLQFDRSTVVSRWAWRHPGVCATGNTNDRTTHRGEFLEWCRKVGLKPEITETPHSTNVSFYQGKPLQDRLAVVEATFTFAKDGIFQRMRIRDHSA